MLSLAFYQRTLIDTNSLESGQMNDLNKYKTERMKNS